MRAKRTTREFLMTNHLAVFPLPGDLSNLGSGYRSRRWRSGLAGAIEHPPNAKPIGKVAEISPPEHFLQRHVNLAAFRKGSEQAVRFRAGIGLEVDEHIVALNQRKSHGFGRVGSHE